MTDARSPGEYRVFLSARETDRPPEESRDEPPTDEPVDNDTAEDLPTIPAEAHVANLKKARLPVHLIAHQSATKGHEDIDQEPSGVKTLDSFRPAYGSPALAPTPLTKSPQGRKGSPGWLASLGRAFLLGAFVAAAFVFGAIYTRSRLLSEQVTELALTNAALEEQQSRFSSFLVACAADLENFAKGRSSREKLDVAAPSAISPALADIGRRRDVASGVLKELDLRLSEQLAKFSPHSRMPKESVRGLNKTINRRKAISAEIEALSKQLQAAIEKTEISGAATGAPATSRETPSWASQRCLDALKQIAPGLTL